MFLWLQLQILLGSLQSMGLQPTRLDVAARGKILHQIEQKDNSLDYQTTKDNFQRDSRWTGLTIHSCLSKRGLNGKRPLLKANHTGICQFAQWQAKCFLWTELFGKAHQLHVHIQYKKKEQKNKLSVLLKKRTLNLPRYMEESRLCSVGALLHLSQGILNLCRIQ